MTIDPWDAGIAYTLSTQLGLGDLVSFKSWWSDRTLLSPVYRFGCWRQEVLLVQIPQPIVIFIDEVDSVLSLEFSTDDFFALIRACYNKRVDAAEYRHLSFALLGVATPSDLMRDKHRPPFNIGRAIHLTGFQFHETKPLLPGLETHAQDPSALLKTILD